MFIETMPQSGNGSSARSVNGIVGAGGRIERQVDVVDDVLLVASLAVDVVGLDRHRAAELALEADRGLEGARQVHELGRPDEFLDGPEQTGRAPVNPGAPVVEGAVFVEQNCGSAWS